MTEPVVIRCPHCRLQIRGGPRRRLHGRIYHQACITLLKNQEEWLTQSKTAG